MLIKVKVLPQAKENQIYQKNSDTYVVHVKEKAEGGQANLSVKYLLADYFQVGEGKIRLIKGGKKPNKIFEIVTVPKNKTR